MSVSANAPHLLIEMGFTSEGFTTHTRYYSLANRTEIARIRSERLSFASFEAIQIPAITTASGGAAAAERESQATNLIALRRASVWVTRSRQR